MKDEFKSFQGKLYTALARKENLVAPPVVFAELMPQFKENTKLLGKFLEEHKIAIEPLGVDSAIAAAQAWMRYLKRKTMIKAKTTGQILPFKKGALLCPVPLNGLLANVLIILAFFHIHHDSQSIPK
ncbi:MAG: hypothetical protein ACT6FF_09775 [Methanosarcinaceae archaeon]